MSELVRYEDKLKSLQPNQENKRILLNQQYYVVTLVNINAMSEVYKSQLSRLGSTKSLLLFAKDQHLPQHSS